MKSATQRDAILLLCLEKLLVSGLERTLTVTGAVLLMPNSFAADRLRSIEHLHLSLMCNVRLFPFSLFVTSTLEPKGNDGCAAVFSCGL